MYGDRLSPTMRCHPFITNGTLSGTVFAVRGYCERFEQAEAAKVAILLVLFCSWPPP